MEAKIQTDKPLSKEQFIAFRAAFKKLANNKELLFDDIMIYHILCGKDPCYGFTPVTRPSKIRGYCFNGNPWYPQTLRINELKRRIQRILDTKKKSPNSGWEKLVQERAASERVYFRSRGYSLPEEIWEYLYEKLEESYETHFYGDNNGK